MQIQFSLTKSSFKKTLLFVSVLFAVSGFMLSINQAQTEALSGSSFKAGRIIDDAVFTNTHSMSASQIQSFLNAKVPTCDTNGTQPSGHAGYATRADWGRAHGAAPPYICLKSYSQSVPAITNSGSDLCTGNISAGTKVAAQIIYDVSRACGINPQVLIVLLQKEQSLVTDVWPWPVQYRSATGYGCPDTAPCDSEYYGFFNQVYQAAQAFNRYARNPTNYNYRYGRNNTILYNPNTACGSSSVFIQNQSTASLYIYTPYQPNRAALNNLYGTGDSCSAYGNRNFWRMFNDWFGSPYGSLLRTTSSSTLYYTDGETRYTIPSMSIINQYGLGLGDVRFVSQQELNDTPLASSPLSTQVGQIVKSPSDSDSDGGSLYLISNGQRLPFTSLAQLSDFGFSTADIHYLSLNAILRLQQPGNLSNFVRTPTDGTIYKIENGTKRLIFSLAKYNQLNTSGKTSLLSAFTLSQLPAGSPIEDGDYMVRDNVGSIRLYNGNGFHTISSMNVYDCWGLNGVKLYQIDSYQRTGGTNSGTLGCFGKDSGGNVFAMAKTRRFQLADSQNISPSETSDSIIQRLPTATMKAVIKGSGSELAVLENNKRRPISSMEVFSALGYSSTNIDTLPQGLYGSFSLGAKKFAPGSLAMSSTGGIYVIASSNSRLAVTSMRQFNDYAFGSKALAKVTNTDLAAYSDAGTLANIVKVGSDVFLIDSGKRYLIASGLDTAVGINRSSLPTIAQQIAERTASKNMTQFIKSDAHNTVYYLENGHKRPFTSWQKLVDMGGNTQITTLSDFRVQQFPTGSSL